MAVHRSANNFSVLILVFIFHFLQTKAVTISAQVPEQVHIAFGSNASEHLVTWHTLNTAPSCQVEYGLEETPFLPYQAQAEVSFNAQISLHTYRALLVDLKPLTHYYYRIACNGTASSSLFRLRTLSDDPTWQPTVAIFGDLGYQNAESLPYLEADVNESRIDAIFHIGDIGYDLHENNGERGNEFMRTIGDGGVASRVPYVTCPGNHERHDNFTHYDARFSMLGDRDQPKHHAPLSSRLNNHYHSLDIGPLHLILFSTEFYYYPHLFGWEAIRRQYEWLEADLARANTNRTARPWIIVMGHRPLYCLKLGDPTCNHQTLERQRIRLGVQMFDEGWRPLQYGLEQLFFNHTVDLQFYGHEHYYARLLPLYRHQVRIGHKENAYEDAQGPIFITSGSAGNRELHPPFNSLVFKRQLVAEHHYDYGYTRVRVLDRLRLLVEQVSADKGGLVVDQFEITKSSDRLKWLP